MRRALLVLIVAMQIAVVTAISMPAGAQEAPLTPFLRVETGLHTARVHRIATDASGRLVATVSNDKTVRLWSRDGGDAVGVMRVPIDRGEEGRLYSVALSPDGETAVAAGYTAATWDGAFAIYLFDVKRQRMTARLTGQPDVIYDMAFSPDGRFVAAVFGGKSGLRVYDSKTFQLLAQDSSYGSRATGLAFDRQGRLATTSFDGKIRLYDAQFHMTASLKGLSGKQPYSVAFSADGRRLAVGYNDAAQVDVLSGDTLAPLFSPSAAGLVTGSLSQVAWSGSGANEKLAAAGSASPDGKAPVLRQWGNGGRGTPVDTVVSRNLITHLRPTDTGGLLFAAADPVWGRLDEQGGTLYSKPSVTGDFRDIYRGRFQLSPDGLTVDFGMEPGGGRPFRFDVREGRLTANPPIAPGFAGPRDAADTLKVTDWRNASAPKVNGKPVALEAGERSLSVDVVAQEKQVLIGSDFALRLVNAQGREIASVQTPAEVWGVVASANGRLAVAALGDGTLRWYSLAGGIRPLEELAALFPHKDGVRWVQWTPEGFFTHPRNGGQDLVGFHLNNSKKGAPLWVEFKQVYQVLYAPELVRNRIVQIDREELNRRISRIGDLRRLTQRAPKITLVEYCAEAAETRGFSRVPASVSPPTEQVAATVAPPCRPIDTSPLTRAFARVSVQPDTDAPKNEGKATPSTTIALPSDMTRLRVRYRVDTPLEETGDIQVFLNGRDVTGEQVTRGFSRVADPVAAPQPATPPAVEATPAPANPIREAVVRIEPGSNGIQLRAYNRTGAIYEQTPVLDFVVPVASRTADATAAEAKPQPKPKPRLISAVAGINAYQAPFPRLAKAAPDARTFAATVRERIPDVYDAAESIKLSRELYDAQASRTAIVAMLQDVAKNSRDDDTVLIYLSGHGLVDPLPEDNVDLYYYITQNVAAGDEATVAREALSERDLASLISGIKARNVLLFLDTCHSGAVETLSEYSSSSIDKLKERAGTGPYLIAAATRKQEARDASIDKTNSGPFARAVIESLVGNNAAAGTLVSQLQILNHVIEKVPEYARLDRWEQDAVVHHGGVKIDRIPITQTKAAP